MADAAQPYTWLRCTGCGSGLWRKYADHIEMTVSPRGGQRRTISAPLAGINGLAVRCEKCNTVTIWQPEAA